MSQFETYALAAVIAFGAVALGAVAKTVVGIIKNKKGTLRPNKTRRAKFAQASKIVVAVLCVVAIVASYIATSTYASSINQVFSKTGTTSTSSHDSGETTTEEDWKQAATQIAEEGMVLLKNEGDALPLSSGTKINLIGYCAYNPYYSGSGSGSTSTSDAVSILQGLQDAGFEVNTAANDAGLYPAKEEAESSIGFDSGSLSIEEPAVSEYTGDASFESMAAYSDVAVVVIGRTGGEGYDLSAYSGGDYLELSQNEQDLLAQATASFDTVIVVYNAANALNMDVLSSYDIDALIWTGEPGAQGFEALGEILAGTVNPSGRTVDTWVYDNDSAPANENYGEQPASNAEGRYYVDYVENIYLGYKWYETAAAEDAVITNTHTGETFDYADYDSVVAYPFGYGLSYTTFTQKITGGTLADGAALDATDAYTLEVTVTNTGDVAGKDVVELYVTAPYTDYDIQNNIEKSEVTLVAYCKTGELEPGESEVVTLEVSLPDDVASWDATHDNGDDSVGAYMLDAGDYTFSIRSDSHTTIDTVTATLADQYFFSGENKRDSDVQVATDQFSEAARGEYLSRNNAFANYESAMSSVSDTIKDPTYASTDEYYDESYDTSVTQTYTEGVDYDADGDLTFADMTGLDYDDPKWNELISQLSLDDLVSMTTDTLYSDPEIKSIDKSGTSDSDGPMGISSMFNANMQGIAYPCIATLAATWNVDLAYQMGSCIADEAASLGVTGWYAPAMDIHRSAYSGRNFEYYSEDGALSAGMSAAEVSGAREKGLIVYIKHFALNDAETHRDSIHTYSNEQAIREIYLRPFEAAVKQGGATGVMTSMNYIGDIYAGANAGLITDVLRGEWGFVGTVLTDMDQAGEARSYGACQRAGVDKWLAVGDISANATPESNADIYYMQRAAHNILYTQANATTVATEISNWHAYLYVFWVELALFATACVVSFVFQAHVAKKSEAK